MKIESMLLEKNARFFLGKNGPKSSFISQNLAKARILGFGWR
jgi:hypothetical protein